jgi:D-alanine-D-alanine ligase
MEESNLILVLSGGNSEEASVSRISAAEVSKALQQNGYSTKIIDPVDFKSYSHLVLEIKSQNPLIVFNGLHGTDGEDGKIQSLFELEGIPYTGTSSRASALAMDKYLSGIIAQYHELKIPKRILLKSLNGLDLKYINDQILYPLVVKPNDSGSSVGISIIENEDELLPAVKEAFKYSDKVLIEKFIEGRELTVTILDDKALPVVEIKPQNGWYDYTNKYTKGNTIYETPAELDNELNMEIQKQAETIFQSLGCSVYARVDFRFDDKNLYFLEVNTLPGMTPLSLTPMAANAAGYSFAELLENIIRISLKSKKSFIRRRL